MNPGIHRAPTPDPARSGAMDLGFHQGNRVCIWQPIAAHDRPGAMNPGIHRGPADTPPLAPVARQPATPSFANPSEAAVSFVRDVGEAHTKLDVSLAHREREWVSTRTLSNRLGQEPVSMAARLSSGATAGLHPAGGLP